MKKSAVTSAGSLVSGAEIENLPSFGMSAYLASDSDAAAMLQKIRDGKDLSKKDNSEDEMRLRHLPAPSGSVSIPRPSFTDDQPSYVLVVQDEHVIDETATTPITTVDDTQIMEDQTEPKKPCLHVKMCTNYLRFRYMSEKCPPKKKGSKPRHYDADDSEKHCLAEVWVDNYTGPGKIVAFCVDSEGNLHPYNLFGDSCHQGVYVSRVKFRPNKVIKLQKVSVTTPRAKEYQNTLKCQQAYLHEVGIELPGHCNFNEIQDKQIVYVMFKVILEDNRGEILSLISTPLQNKKKGKEFRIDDIEPVSAAASGDYSYNITKNRVMLHVTENTAFPSEVGVKIRERDAEKRIVWEVDLSGDKITVVKQCVVKFVPPPYKNPGIREDVETEICLYDNATKIETEPVKFIYRGLDSSSQDFENKTKKRKLDEDVIMHSTFAPGQTTQGERKILQALRTIPSPTSSRASNGSSPEGSLGYIAEPHPNIYTSVSEAEPSEAAGSDLDDRAVSLREQRNADGLLPFSGYTLTASQTENEGHFPFGPGSSQTVSHPTSPQSAGFRRDSENSGTISNASMNPSSIVTSSTSVFGTTQQKETYQTATITAPTVSVNSNPSNSSFQPVQQQEQTEIPESNAIMITDADKLMLSQQGVQLPKLGPNQMLALIDGQIYVVNDDTIDQKSDQTSGAMAEASTNIAQNIEENVGQQQVIVQQIASQQPSTETEQAGVQMPASTTQILQGSVQSQSEGALGHNLQQQLLMQLQQQQQQQLQQQQALEVVQQLVANTGIDVSQPGVLQSLLQQVLIQQMVLSNQQQVQTSGMGSVLAPTSNMDDDDLEIDGEVNNNNGGHFSNCKLNNKENTESSNREEVILMQDEVVYETGPECEDDTASRIPVFVNEVIIEDDSSNSESSNKNEQTKKHVHFKLKNGSFNNGESSEEEDDV